MNVLFHQAALGDFVLTFPLLRSLPGPTVVVAPWSKALLAARLFEQVTPMDIEMWEFARLHAAGGPTSVSPAIGELFSAAACIISFVSVPGDAWAVNVARLAPQATIAHVQPRPPVGWTRHVTLWHREQLAALDLPEAGAAEAVADPTATNDRIVVHPGSGGRDKCWPIDRFETAMQALRVQGRDVVAVLGEAELERWPREQVQRWRSAYAVQTLSSLEELHDVLAGASVYLGNDAGPTHLAAQLGLATTALFGPTDPRVWSPIGPAVTVLAPPSPQPMSWLSVEAVVAACGTKR